MSREIKFRVWDDVNKKFWYIDREDILCNDRDYCCFNHENYKKAIIQQFTGLKDKNGKEIYEGDIIKRRNFFISGLEIVKKEEYDIFAVEWASAGFWNFAANDTNKTSALFEIIGNIHEKPELLK